MKATLEIPDELYALVKARAALEGRTLRSVAIELFAQWAKGETVGGNAPGVEEGKPRHEVASQAMVGMADDLEKHRAHLRGIMRHPRSIDEIAGILAGPGPDMDMAAMRKAYEQRLADEWKRRRG